MASLFQQPGHCRWSSCSRSRWRWWRVGRTGADRRSLSLIAAIGIIMLVGLMGRNAILLLDYTTTLRARGMAATAAHRGGGRDPSAPYPE